MSRRVSLPGADPTRSIHAVPAGEADGEATVDPDGLSDAVAPQDATSTGEPRSSGRVRHEEKMTVYVTADELFELETARLSLRHRHGVAVDRGRLVREAIAIVLADLDQQGADSPLARRLTVS